jgi:type I restriction enzyme S subunit
MAIIFKILVSCLRRIVARVDQLMSLCDELEIGLMRSKADSERLMEAVVGRMLAE